MCANFVPRSGPSSLGPGKRRLWPTRAYCATKSGNFEIDFIRIKEYSLDVQFTEKVRWSSGQFDVSVELAADESIHDYRIGFIAPCVCREIPYDD